MDKWAAWNPAAGFLHFSTKDQPFEAGEAQADVFLAQRLAERPIPPAMKTYVRRAAVPLPKASRTDPFSRVLLQRRTWRRFGRRPLAIRELGTLMWLVFGAQHAIELGAGGRAILSTSPSAGARNPLEAYVVVRHVAGLSPGIYHYAPVDHRLTRLKNTARGVIERHLPGQCVVRSGVDPRPDHGGVRQDRVEVSRAPCLSRRAVGGRPLLPDVLASRPRRSAWRLSAPERWLIPSSKRISGSTALRSPWSATFVRRWHPSPGGYAGRHGPNGTSASRRCSPYSIGRADWCETTQHRCAWPGQAARAPADERLQLR